MTADQLKERLGGIFATCDGPARAYFQFSNVCVDYSLFHVCMVGDSDQVGQLLCDWAYATLAGCLTDEQKEDRAIVLFWRRHPVLEEFTNAEGKPATALRFRLAIPDFTTLPKGFRVENGEPLWL